MMVFIKKRRQIFFAKLFLSVIFSGVAAIAAAHTYFFGFTEINLNQQSKHLEVIHQFTAHDIENVIAEIKQIHFSPEHPQYDEFIQQYIEQNFVLKEKNKEISLHWIGSEVKRGQLFAYQESVNENFFTKLLVKNTILTNTYPKQVNTVNYQNLGSTGKIEGSLTFNQSVKTAIINPNEENNN